MTRHSVEKTRRQYNILVATETLEDYALRYAPSSFRRWSPLLLANTAIGSISFLACEAIGATLLLGFGYSNAAWAIVLASIIIFAAGLPISYYAARYNIDIDLLTRSAGFGYVGSTITSLIYASFCFIFFALEASIMAQALKLYFELPLYLGYILCSLIIIPIVFYGITAINRLHLWTQPVWLILMLLPLYFLYTQAPHTIEALTHFQGQLSGSNEFDPYYFGIAAGISFSLIAQIGEQVDYLRFMPDKHKGNRLLWWSSMLAAGPGWIVLGCFKQLVGVLLASIAVLSGLAYAEAKEPVQMYYVAYTYVFEHPSLALLVSTVFVVISQIKINVTNAYAGSLAWSNFFSRTTHTHPGRVVWLVFNIGIALLLMELGVFDALQKVLGLYSNFAIAWIAVVVADLTINKPLKLSPSIIEFKRAHLYDYNPVGVVSMGIAVLSSTLAFTGLFGLYAQAYSWLIALVTAFVLTPLIAKLTKGKYYIARQNVHFTRSDELRLCGVCEQHYAQTDFAYCPFYDAPICSLCCTLDANCKDQCKPLHQQPALHLIGAVFRQEISNQTTFRITKFSQISGVLLGIVGLTFWLYYSVANDQLSPLVTAALSANLSNLFFVLAVLICILAWWIVLGHESQALAETELEEQNKRLDVEITERKAVAQELNNRTAEIALHNEILKLISRENKLSVILDRLAHQVETLHPGMLCSILLLDEDGKHLRHGAAPSLPDFYNHAIDGLVIGEGVGSCGTAAFRGERIIVEDVQHHPYWEPFRDLARLANLQACWSQPIKNNQGRVLGTFAVYHRQPVQPTDAEISLIDHYTGLAQLAIERNRSTLQIAESLSILKATLESTGEAILAVDLNNNWLLHNQKFIDLWQIPNEIIAAEMGAKDQLYRSNLIKNQIKDAEAFTSKVTELYATPEAHSFDIIEFKDGKIIERYSIPQMINNKVVGRVWSFRDVTEQKQAEAELRIAATAFESQGGMSITDANQVILKVNKAFTRITGYSPEEAVGQTHALLSSGRQDAHFYRALQHSLKQDGYWEGEIWNRRKNGEIYPEWLSITTVSDVKNQITNYVAAFTDITKIKETEKAIHNLAYYDPLTALPNRRLLWERLKHGIEVARRDGKQLALLMLDLDRFKTVNDSMGHLAGDELLQQVAVRIKAKLRDVDMVARLGGDEFIVLLEDITHLEDAARVAEDIVSDLSRPFQLLESSNIHPELSRKVKIGASIGISLFPQHGDNAETLLDNADIALYKAKDEGRGCFAYFSEEFTLIARERIALETRLRRATEQRELCVYYQAQIDIDSGLIIGAEALVRWQDPTEGLISPARFIPIAEETGLIVEIGAWVLRETCLQGRRWIDAGLPSITLAVNISPHQFRRSDISALMAEVLHETGFPAALLELELTESGLMENEEKAVEVLNNLRAQGVRLAIDDFGTGYSSLAYLKRFPLDVLKIDKSFIEDIPSLQDDMEITATIIAMGHILGFKVLAEGVETLEQLAFLREKGCDTYQGFIKSRPLPAEEFARLLREQV